MVFSSISFISIFLPALLALYYAFRKRLSVKNIILLIFSLGFYFVGEPKGSIIMLISIASNYTLALLMDRSEGGKKKALLLLAVSINLGILLYYKYLGFFIANVNNIFRTEYIIPEIIMPIGISFFTFQGMSYVIDVYRSTVPVQRNILYVALYISMFPQLIAGPIVRYETIALELEDRQESLEAFYDGLRRFIIGFAKKVLLANSIGALATEIFEHTDFALTTPLAWLGAIAYTFQIYYDFSGYSDMAIGLGKLFGFNFPENFNYPYISSSITEFWRRWHMSLSSWFRDYVYIPLGGSRCSKSRNAFNIFLVWALTGLWHGASWNFVLWGMYFAVILIIEKLFLLEFLKKLPRAIRHIYALFFIIIGWAIFNSPGLSGASSYIKTMFVYTGYSGNINFVWLFLYKYWMVLLACTVFSVPIPALKKKSPVTDLLLIAVFIAAIISLITSTFNPFIYFRF